MNIIKKIQNINFERCNLILKAFGIEDSIEKARSGVYANTHENRKLGRVGQRYGGKKVEDGKQITKEQRDKNFKTWFGNSKVVDKDGKPLVVYHGTNREVSEFKLEEADIEASYGKAFYFSDSSKEASKYALSHKDHKERGTNNASVLPVYLKMENPVYVSKTKIDVNKLYEIYSNLDTDDKRIIEDIDRFVKVFNKKELSVDELELSVRLGKFSGGRVKRIFELLGYDGIIYSPKKDLKIKEEGNHYVVFNSNQIKSATGNDGSYDPNSNDITKAL